MTGETGIITPAEARIITPKVSRWAARIAQRWARGVEAIIQTGQMLTEAKADCAHGDWQVLVEELPFGRSHAFMLMAIAECLPIVQHVKHLPSDTYTLYQLSRLPEARFEKLLKDAVIHPAMARKDASAETNAERLAADEARVAKLAPVEGRFPTMLIDPPWRDEELSESAQANTPYATMTVDEIAALPVPGWARSNSHLYLCTTNNRVWLAGGIMAGWGFKQKSILTWNKKTKDGSKPKNGRGRYFLNSTEQVLFGVKGKLMTRATNIRTGFDGPVAGHSEKPDELYDIIRRASPGPYGEAFQGQPRKGFKNLFGVKDDG